MKKPQFAPYLLSLFISLMLVGCSDNLHSSRFVHPRSFDVSPDSRQIVYSCEGSGGADIYLYDLATRHITRLTNSPDYESDPAFSPDGKSIVYASARNLSSPHFLFLRSLDGTNVRQLTRDTASADSSPSFSWSGQKVVFCRSSQFLNGDVKTNNWDKQDVYTVNRNGTGLRRLTQGSYELLIRPRFYPGDDAVLFETLHINSVVTASGVGMQGGLARVSASGGQPVPLIGSPQPDDFYATPSFTPDGKQIIYGINHNGTVSVYRSAPDGSGSQSIKTGGVGSAYLDAKMSPDGKHIYYTNRDDMSLWEMNTNGGNVHRLVVAASPRKQGTK